MAGAERQTSMRQILSVFATLAVWGTVLLAGAPPAYGCSCLPVSIEEAVRPDSVAAFTGTPISSRDIGYEEGPGWREPIRWTFRVDTVLHGEVAETVEVGTGYGSGDCGIDFTNQGRVGIVAYEDDIGLATGICGGVWEADELIAAHGPGYAPTPGGQPGQGVALWGLLIGVVIVGGSLFYATRPSEPSPPGA